MEKEKDKTASIQVTFTTGHRNLPYAVNLEEDHHPMIWLSREPERIDEIPELKGEPELKEFVRAINGPGLHFETFRCSHRTGTDQGHVIRTMYVALIFRDRKLAASLDNYMVLIRGILTGVAASKEFPDNALPFEVRLHKHWLKEEELWVHTADIQFHIQALDEARMREELGRQTAFLEKILNHP
ncbi:hypothetical protein HX780_06730 [Pseudomonas tolaasii]|uniref:hypothetical protein n=1 Tax=Pseudomonas tolaasii TaxID=29442 RepID=UPI0015A1B260|nr:hypothetical protein [Pseudomonas tolaasii]NVZ45125.1 hypothetical protein [Pseudomonas tolaasii]NWA47987.1 hypothetical protein [Pseudomonas tolaasii]